MKVVALFLLTLLPLTSSAQRKTQLCRIASGPLAGMLEQAAVPGSPGAACADAAGNRGTYISADEEIKHRPGLKEPPYPSPVPPPPPPPPPAMIPGLPAKAPDAALQPVPPTELLRPQPAQEDQAHPPQHGATPVVVPAPPGTAHKDPVQPSTAQDVHLWFEKLPQGSVKYDVPTRMVLGVPVSATATLHPPGSTATASGGGLPLKVSTYMRMVLAQPDNPDTFTIVPEASSCKFVPVDADTTWTFEVTPILPGESKHLSFSAYAVYGVDDSSCAPGNLKLVNVLSQTETVTIAAITRQRAWQQIVVSFVSDPAKWFNFILPGGAGFAVIAGLIAWWRKRKAGTGH